MDDDIPYLLLTPGPLTTSRTVREVMLRDYCTWDDDYNSIVRDIRRRLVALAAGDERHTAVLMQGSGTFAVEATLGSVVPPSGKLLVVNNGAYGARIAKIASRLGIPCTEIVEDERHPAVPDVVEEQLRAQPQITHIAMVHCETTTGMVNPVEAIGRLAQAYEKTYIVDAMSSLGGMPLSMDQLRAQYVISSSNKCIQGVPGFGFVVADREDLAATQGWARSLSLDLFDQWQEMENHGGKWRFTSPTHTVRAFACALDELDAEGGVPARYARYCENHRILVEGMESVGFRPLLATEHRSPIITSFLYRDDPRFSFQAFYDALKRRRFVIYPGKVSHADTFRIGTIGHVFPDDIRQLITAVAEAAAELGLPDRGASPDIASAR